jgi:DNA-binding SARP family transcriptional activator
MRYHIKEMSKESILAMAIDPLAGRVTVVLGAAGYGKTTAVRRWLGERPASWLDGAALDGVERIVIADHATTVIDDAHRLAASPLIGVVAPHARVVLIGRRPVGWAPNPRAEIGPARLALPVHDVGVLLRERYGVENPEVAPRVHRLTDGWPALVELIAAGCAQAPHSDQELLAMLAAPGTPLEQYTRAEVLADLPGRRLLADVAGLGSMSVDLAGELGHRRPEAALSELTRLGLCLPSPIKQGWYRTVPALAAVLRSGTGRRREQRVVGVAAGWHRREGRPMEALRLRRQSADHAGCVEILATDGADLLAGGEARAVAEAVRALPAALRDRRTELLLAQALEMTGDSAGAVAVYAALAGSEERLAPGLAWRYGVALYLWVDPAAALAVFRRGVLSAEDTADEALLLGWSAAAHWLAGDLPACRDFAERAQRAATAADDRRALATAYVALALCANLAGQPAALQANYARALELAEASGDVVQAIRIRANLAVALEREARYADALAMLGPAVVLAERAGHISLLAMASCNAAVQAHRLGRFDEAAAGYARSIELYQLTDSRKVAYPLNNLGDLHRQRGRRSEARAAYEEARRTAAADGNRQGLAPALAGLARTVAFDDPELAAALAGEAIEYARGPLEAAAHLAAGYAALGGGAPDRAGEHATLAADAARQHRDRAALAEALELRAAATATADPRSSRQTLGEALAIWRGAGAGLDADRVLLALGQLGGAHPRERLDARLATQRLTAAGVILARAVPSVRIQALGRFTVVVDGVPAPPWQSRKARDLLRILVARRGRPVPRDELVELLWGEAGGGDDRIAHRFAVALSTVRGVLDPGRRSPVDQFIAAGATNLWIDVERVAVDVELFLSDAGYGLRLAANGEAADAYAVLTAVTAGGAGAVFADDPYDDWARGLRAEVETARLDVARALARLTDDPGEAARHLEAVLDADPYDERSHHALLRVLRDAGRHGAARQAYGRYRLAMDEIGVPAAEFDVALRSG